MLHLLSWLFRLPFLVAGDKQNLILENLALRQQVALLQRHVSRPRPKRWERIFWVLLKRLWPRWESCLAVFQPRTIIRWHRAGFRALWRWRSRPGRPAIDPEIRQLIRSMALSNSTWGTPRIHGELKKLGIEISESTVAKYLPKRKDSPGDEGKRQRWKTFLHNHLGEAVGIDLFTIPTATFQVLFGFVIISHLRRRILHIGVTYHPNSEWISNQIMGVFAFEDRPRYLHRDRDGACQGRANDRIRLMGIEQVLNAPQSPWQNPYCERVIGSIRRDLLDHVIVLGDEHARRLLSTYLRYYNADRTHLSLEKDAPESRPVETDTTAPVIALPRLGGLHHRYERQAEG